MMRELLLVGAGSAVGGIGRLLTGRVMGMLLQTSWPLATFSVNVTGSLLIGLLFGWQSRGILSGSAMLFLATGLCGGFTTFSTFSYENLQLIRQGQTAIALAYMVASALVSLLGVFIGFQLGK
jgi:CrcB protein